MGLAIACATNNRIVLKCDDSPLTGASDQETGSKIKSFDDTILLAYTGDKAFCEQAVTAFERLYMLSSISPVPLPELVEMFRNKMVLANQDAHCNCSFLISGKKDEMFLIFGMSSSNQFEINMQFTTPEFDETDIECFVIGDPMAHAVTTFEQFFRQQNPGQTIESVMNQYILYVSSVEDNVSDIIHTQKIR